MALAVVLLTLLMTSQAVALNCIKVDDCTCKFDDLQGAVISMRPLINHTSGPPLFQDVLATDGKYYSYNPCYQFNEGNCTDSAICQLLSLNGTSTTLASQSDVEFGFIGGNVQFTYFSKDRLVQATVNFKCVDNMTPPQFTAYGMNPSDPTKYEFEVESMCACSGVCILPHPPAPSSSSIGGGSVVLIVFFSLVFLYLVVGSIYGKVVKKANGLEALPNYEFWVGLPNTLKEGSLCVVRCVCCRPERKTYDEV
ncbi:hypothetical protein BsWGS_00403 [Bradybaena similaris]